MSKGITVVSGTAGKKFEVVGNGTLFIDAPMGSHWMCGTAKGIGVACSWGTYGGKAMGTMDKAVVKELVEHLQNWLDSQEADHE